MKNCIGGDIEELTLEQFLGRFEAGVRDALLANGRKPGVSHLVLFENLDFCSSNFGQRTALIVGPGCTYTLEQAAGNRLGDVPSRFQYPVAYCAVGPVT